jgi:hypothetical protein
MSEEPTYKRIDLENINVSNLYPTDRSNYCFYTGELGESVITTIVKNILPYTEIPYHNVVVNGSDLKIYYHGKLLAKFEILNFDSRSYINFRRAKSIRENLKNVKYKGLICSFFNATSKARDILKNIPVCTIGFQLLPSKFHQYYARLNKVHHRRIANNRSLKQIKNRIKSFFYRIGLDLLMYVSRTRISVSNTLNLKNTNLNIDVKNVETENKEARIEGNTQTSTSREYIVPTPEEGTEKCSSFSSTSREYTVSTISVGTEIRRLETKEIGKISTVSVKIRSFYNRLKISILNLLSGIEMLFSKIWNDKHGEVTLANWISVKVKTKLKTKNRKRLFQCPFRITLVCQYHKQFYACLIQTIDNYITKMEKYGYNQEQIEKLVDRTILRHTWKSKNQILGKCKCKPISFIDDEITSRRAYNGIAVTEPCKKMRCSQLIKDGKCEWIELLSEHKVKPRQLKLVGFVNGDDQHGQT